MATSFGLDLRTLGLAAALGSAAFFALSNALVGKGLQGGKPWMGHCTTVILNTALLWPVALIFIMTTGFSLTGIVYFVVAGLLTTGFGRLLSFVGFDYAGVSKSTPVVYTSPVFSALLAVLVLGESITANVAFGTCLTILGVMFLKPLTMAGITRRGIAISLVSAGFYGGGQLFRKLGIVAIPNPTLGAAIGSTTATMLALTYISAFKKMNLQIGTLNRYFVFSSIASAIAQLFVFVSYDLTDLITVAGPANSTIPLFTLVFAYLFLRDHEKINLQTIGSSVTVVLGTLLIFLR